jgi:hypothetical protein
MLIDGFVIVLACYFWAMRDMTYMREPYHKGEWWDAWHWFGRLSVSIPLTYILVLVYLSSGWWYPIIFSLIGTSTWITIRHIYKPPHYPDSMWVRLVKWGWKTMRGYIGQQADKRR